MIDADRRRSDYYRLVLATPHSGLLCDTVTPTFLSAKLLGALLAVLSAPTQSSATWTFIRSTMSASKTPSKSTKTFSVKSDTGRAPSTSSKHHWEGKISMGTKLGSGSYGMVHAGLWERDGKAPTPVAIKIFKKKEIINTRDTILSDIKLCMTLKHKNVIKILEWSELKNSLVLITELAEGGNLYSRLDKAKEFSETDSAEVTYQILDALNYIHGLGIIHRDIKPENILFKHDPNKPEKIPKYLNRILLCDFDQAIYSKGEPAFGEVGTGLYMAPEILDTKTQVSVYNELVDVWSTGITCSVMLTGDVTFYMSMVEVSGKQAILKGPGWSEISIEAVNFLYRCLKVDPKERDTPADLMKDKWLQQGKLKDQAGGIRKNLVTSDLWKKAITKGMKTMGKKKGDENERFKNVLKEVTSASEVSHSENGNWPLSDVATVRKRKASPGRVTVEPAGQKPKK